MNFSLLLPNNLRVSIFNCKRFLNRRVPKPAKPPILPPSKQVLYRVVNGDWLEPEHVKELLWRRHVYNNAMMSIRTLFKNEIKARENAGLGIEELKRLEMIELEELFALNEKRNAQSSAERAVYEHAEMEKLKENTIDEIMSLIKEEEKDVAKRTLEVEECIAQSKNFITYENLRSKIEEALENPVVFEFAIDINGKQLSSQPPVKFIEGHPIRQKGRLYDETHGNNLLTATPVSHKQNVEKKIS